MITLFLFHLLLLLPADRMEVVDHVMVSVVFAAAVVAAQQVIGDAGT